MISADFTAFTLSVSASLRRFFSGIAPVSFLGTGHNIVLGEQVAWQVGSLKLLPPFTPDQSSRLKKNLSWRNPYI